MEPLSPRPVLGDMAGVQRPRSTSLASPWRGPISKGEIPGTPRGARAGHTHAHTHTCNMHTPGWRLHGAEGAVGHPHPAGRPQHLPSASGPPAGAPLRTPRPPRTAGSRYQVLGRLLTRGARSWASAGPEPAKGPCRLREGGASRAPAALTTTASLSATDPAIFSCSTAGDVGHGARAEIQRRSCAGRGRGSETGSSAHTHTGARACTPGGPASTRLAGPGGGGGEGGGREDSAGPEVGGGRRSPDRAAESRLLSSSGCCCPRKKESRAAPCWPWAAFKGRQSPAGEPGTGRGAGCAAAACSACPAPQPLDGGRRLGREGLAYQGRGVREGGRSEERRVGKECRSRWSPYH